MVDALRPGSTFIVNGKQHPVIVPTLAERLHEKNEELAALLAEQTALEELKAQSDKKANRVRAAAQSRLLAVAAHARAFGLCSTQIRWCGSVLAGSARSGV